MATRKQIKAAKINIKKAQKKWKLMTPRQRAVAQPQGKKRAKPGTKSGGKYYHIVVRPKYNFTSFRTQDVGKKGHCQRVAGHRASGSWDTHKWLISKGDATKKGNYLSSDVPEVKEILDTLQSRPKHVKGDIFKAKPEKNVPEKDKARKSN